jgi:hypothetical protein
VPARSLPAAALVDLLTKHEHTPAVVAGTLRYAVQQHDNPGLVRMRLAGPAAIRKTRIVPYQGLVCCPSHAWLALGAWVARHQ